jgi:hypothetical protein
MRKIPLSSIRGGARRYEEGAQPAPAFSRQKPANTRHWREWRFVIAAQHRVTPRKTAPVANPKDGVLATTPSAAPLPPDGANGRN